MIKYDKLFTVIKSKGLSEYVLRKNGISPSILAKLKNGTGGLDYRTINKICSFLDCQPYEIMEYVRTDDDPKALIYADSHESK